MKYNILIHAINWIWLWHINRTVLLAQELQKEEQIGEIIFVTNSKNPFLIKDKWFKLYKLDYWIEDTIKKINFNEYEKNVFNKITTIINKNRINIVIHDTYFIKLLLENRRDIRHFLMLRNSELGYLNTIKKYLPIFKKIYIPHIKDELSYDKLDFYKKYKNVSYIGYIVKQIKLKTKKNKKIIISPWYWWDYNNTLLFFDYINNLLNKGIKNISRYEIIFVLWKHYNKIKWKINFIHNSLIIDFYKDLDIEIWWCELFIWRWWYNTVNEVVVAWCKSLLFDVKRFEEKQWERIEFFKKNFGLDFMIKWTYEIDKDIINLSLLLNNNFKNDIKKYNNFNWTKIFKEDFIYEISKKNILIFKHIFLPKSENFINEEIISLKNVNPIIFTLNKENEDFFLNNLEIIYIEKFKKLLIWDYPIIRDSTLYIIFLKYMVYFIKKNNINLVYTEFLFDAFFILKIKKLLPYLKIISAWRWYDVYSFLKNNYVLPENFLGELDMILVRDNVMFNNILTYLISKKNITITKTVIDFDKYNFVKKDFSKLNILIWGRFVEKKWIIELLFLIKLLIKIDFIWNIWLVWDWELKEKIFHNIEKYWLTKKIKYYWFLDHTKFLTKVDKYNCFINYSRQAKNWDNEWINNIIVENMLSWNIVFSTIVGWIWEIISDKKTWIVLTGEPEVDYIKIKDIFKSIDFSYIIDNWKQIIYEKMWKKNSIKKLENIINTYV